LLAGSKILATILLRLKLNVEREEFQGGGGDFEEERTCAIEIKKAGCIQALWPPLLEFGGSAMNG